MARIGFMASEEMSFENVENDGRTTTIDGRRMPAYTISSPTYTISSPAVQVNKTRTWIYLCSDIFFHNETM